MSIQEHQAKIDKMKEAGITPPLSAEEVERCQDDWRLAALQILSGDRNECVSQLLHLMVMVAVRSPAIPFDIMTSALRAQYEANGLAELVIVHVPLKAGRA